MTEEEMYSKDLNTIYSLIRIHADMNGAKQQEKPEDEMKFIDNIIF